MRIDGRLMYLVIFFVFLASYISVSKNFIVRNQSNANDVYFVVNGSTGRVGVGTPSPSYNLDVYGNIRATGTIYGNVQGSLSGTADNSKACNADGTCEVNNLDVSGTIQAGSSNIQLTNSQGYILETAIYQNSLDDSEIQDNSLTAASLAPNSVTSSELADNAVDTAAIQNGAVTNAKISEMDWVKLQNYPSACPSGQAVTAVGDTLTCTSFDTSSSNEINRIDVKNSGGTTQFSLNPPTDSIRFASGSPLTVSFNSATHQVTYDISLPSCPSGQVLTTTDGNTFTCVTDRQGVTGTGSNGYVAVWNGPSSITYDSGQLFWDFSNNRLGIGTSSPGQKLDVAGYVRANRFEDRDNTGYYVDPSAGTSLSIAGDIYGNSNGDTDLFRANIMPGYSFSNSPVVSFDQDELLFADNRFTVNTNIVCSSGSIASMFDGKPDTQCYVKSSSATTPYVEIDFGGFKHYMYAFGYMQTWVYDNGPNNVKIEVYRDANAGNGRSCSDSDNVWTTIYNGPVSSYMKIARAYYNYVCKVKFTFSFTDDTDGDGYYEGSVAELMAYRNYNGALISGVAVHKAGDTMYGSLTVPRIYDKDNTGYYLDPASTSYMYDVRASIIYDRDNTGYYLNPASTSKLLYLILAGRTNCGKLYTDSSGNVLCGTDNTIADTHANVKKDNTLVVSNPSALNFAGSYWSVSNNNGQADISISCASLTGSSALCDGNDAVNDADSSPTNELQHIWRTINAPSGTDPVPDSTTDTLNLAVASGSGLTITGDSSTDTLTFGIDFNTIQKRVSGSCPAGSSIRIINSDGTVTCENDDQGVTGTGSNGYVAVWNGPSSITYDSGQLFWDFSNNRLGIGTSSPGQKLDVAGNIRATGQLISTVSTGTAPLVVSSTTKVANLNADLLDGYDSSAFGDATLANQQEILNRIGQSSDAASLNPSTLFSGIKGIIGRVDNSYSAAFKICETYPSGSCNSGNAPICPSGWTKITYICEGLGSGLYRDCNVCGLPR